VAGLTESTYRRTAANFLCRWAVQELVEFAVRNEVSLGMLLTSSVPWQREPRWDVPMIPSPPAFNPDGLHDIVGTQ
jgi:hypothetical protein